ncbi:MAG TPA: ATP-binding cassette domain-containing protein [Gammaproteobacteria bacterium]|nr:ATP-binding cassette domain-containing protein [Gammaproteobacteria bacterium]
MQTDTLIQCEDLIPQALPFDYQGDALDLKINTGEVVSIIGPNYSGKGNWIRTICGLEDQLSGKVLIKGMDTLDISAREWALSRMRVAYLHEDTALLSAANALINVLAPALYHRLDRTTLDKPLLTEKARALLNDIDPDINLYDLPAYIDKDQRYKIAIARALLLEPDVLALNNPFAHFNSDSKYQFQTFLEKQNRTGLSLLFVTHDIPYALAISDKIIFTSRDNLLHFDSKQAILDCDIPVVSEFITRQGNRAIA